MMIKEVSEMIARIKGLFKDEEGATMPEYALMVALIAIVVAVGAALLGTNINAKLNRVATTIGT